MKGELITDPIHKFYLSISIAMGASIFLMFFHIAIRRLSMLPKIIFIIISIHVFYTLTWILELPFWVSLVTVILIWYTTPAYSKSTTIVAESLKKVLGIEEKQGQENDNDFKKAYDEVDKKL